MLVAGTRAVAAWAIALSSASAHAVHSRELCALSLKADLELPALQTFRTFSRKSTNSPTCNRFVILRVELRWASHFFQKEPLSHLLHLCLGECRLSTTSTRYHCNREDWHHKAQSSAFAKQRRTFAGKLSSRDPGAPVSRLPSAAASPKGKEKKSRDHGSKTHLYVRIYVSLRT